MLICLVFSACSTEEKPDTTTELIDADLEDRIKFNHSLLVLDSATYHAMLNSTFIKQFAFSYEKQMDDYEGFYLIGATNYLEFFHPKSLKGETLEEGEIWICLASLKANYLKSLDDEKLDFVRYESDDQFNYLSLLTKDSINPIATWEMRKEQYESWTKKVYHDSINFLPVDYNSPQESDSSQNYYMNDVIGIGMIIATNDSIKVVDYLVKIGFSSLSEFNGHSRFSNSSQFIELHVSDLNISPTIDRYYLQLNSSMATTTELIGNSRLECDDKMAIWYFDH